MKSPLSILLFFIFLGSSIQAQNTLNGFENIDFGTKEYNLKNHIKILESVYGYENYTEKGHKKIPNLKIFRISTSNDTYTNYKFYFTAPGKNNERYLYAAANGYKFDTKTGVCEKFNEIKKTLKEKYDWESINGGYKGDCCSCEKSLETYRPKEANYNPYAMYYRKIFSADNKNRVYLDAYRTKSGYWFVREFYFVDWFNDVFLKYYSI